MEQTEKKILKINSQGIYCKSQLILSDMPRVAW